MTRLFDYPDHRFYGPVRRCWVILSGMCPDMALLDQHYFWEWGKNWDNDLADQLSGDDDEAQALRTIVANCLDLYPD